MIGRFLELSVYSEDLLGSIGFYEDLGFRQLDTGETWSHPYAVLSDGRIEIGLHHYEFESPSITFVLADLALKLPHIERQGIEFAFRKTANDEFNEAGFLSPDGQMVTLLEARTFSPPSFDDTDLSLLGRAQEYCVPVRDIEGSIEFWESIGLRLASRNDTPHERALLSAENIVIGLHERPALRQPCLRYSTHSLNSTAERLERIGLSAKETTDLRDADEPALSLKSPEGLSFLICRPAAKT